MVDRVSRLREGGLVFFLRRRIEDLESKAWERERARLESLSDAELAELAELAGDCTPKERAVVRAMTDGELRYFLGLPPGFAGRYFGAMCLKYSSEVEGLVEA